MPTDPNDTSWLDSLAGDLAAEKAEADARRTALREEQAKARANAPKCERCGRRLPGADPAFLGDDIKVKFICERCGDRALAAAIRSGKARIDRF